MRALALLSVFFACLTYGSRLGGLSVMSGRERRKFQRLYSLAAMTTAGLFVVDCIFIFVWALEMSAVKAFLLGGTLAGVLTTILTFSPLFIGYYGYRTWLSKRLESIDTSLASKSPPPHLSQSPSRQGDLQALAAGLPWPFGNRYLQANRELTVTGGGEGTTINNIQTLLHDGHYSHALRLWPKDSSAEVEKLVVSIKAGAWGEVLKLAQRHSCSPSEAREACQLILWQSTDSSIRDEATNWLNSTHASNRVTVALHQTNPARSALGSNTTTGGRSGQ